MKLHLHFKNLQALDHHKEFILAEAEEGVGRYERNKEFIVDIFVKKNVKAHKQASDLYECEVTFKGDRTRSLLFFKKTDANFYTAIRKALEATEKTLRRESRTRAVRRRRNFNRTQQELAA